jgi:hypothetical protein
MQANYGQREYIYCVRKLWAAAEQARLDWIINVKVDWISKRVITLVDYQCNRTILKKSKRKDKGAQNNLTKKQVYLTGEGFESIQMVLC